MTTARQAGGGNSTGQAGFTGCWALKATSEVYLPEAGKLCEKKLFAVAVGVAVSGIAVVLIVLRLVYLEAVIGFVVAVPDQQVTALFTQNEMINSLLALSFPLGLRVNRFR
jgi:hypothetical protein